jgi:ribosomal subunit interface protein
VDIVVTGRHTTVPEKFRRLVEVKITKLERFDHKAFRVDAELSREHNPRMSDVRQRVELTMFSRGPVIRAEASAADPYAALERAAAKLAERLRRAADRRAHHAGASCLAQGLPHEALPPGAIAGYDDDSVRVASALATGRRGNRRRPGNFDDRETDLDNDATGADGDRYAVGDHSPMVVREKTHSATPMTLDDALSNMELVGHDFYLFRDLHSGVASVVYRRCGYDYGVIRLEGEGESPQQADSAADPASQARERVVTA